MFASILTNWKTSLAGGLTALGGVLGLVGVAGPGIPTDKNTAIAAIVTGIGLIFANDLGVPTATPAPKP